MFTRLSSLLPKKMPDRANNRDTNFIQFLIMTQIIEFSLPRENYLEYLRLLRSHGIRVAYGYAMVVSRPDYKNREPLACARLGRAKK